MVEFDRISHDILLTKARREDVGKLPLEDGSFPCIALGWFMHFV